MSEPDVERLAELYDAWREHRPPTFAGQYNDVLPMMDFEGKRLSTYAKVTWNPFGGIDRTGAYEMEPVTPIAVGAYENAELRIPVENYPQFLEVWADAGITTFHRVDVIGAEVPEPQLQLPECLRITTITK